MRLVRNPVGMVLALFSTFTSQLFPCSLLPHGCSRDMSISVVQRAVLLD